MRTSPLLSRSIWITAMILLLCSVFPDAPRSVTSSLRRTGAFPNLGFTKSGDSHSQLRDMDSCSDGSVCSWLSGDPRHIESPDAVPFNALALAATESSCLSKCPPGVVNANCASGALVSSEAKSVGELLGWIESGKKRIEPKELVTLFQTGRTAEDPCGRGPTVLSASGLVNMGGDCKIETTLAQLNARLEIRIPKRLAGTWETRTFPMRIRFGSNDAPIVRILKARSNTGRDEPHPLDSEFGGRVLWAEADARRLYVRTNGCVGVSF
jgi:hypothetical protein